MKNLYCPYCGAKGKLFVHIVDKRLKREIDSLRIRCTNKEEGCQWIGEVGSLKDHLESASGCGFVEVECPNRCEIPSDSDVDDSSLKWKMKKLKRKDLEFHLKNKCEFRPYQCTHCGYEDTFLTVIAHHYNICPEFPLQCPNKCSKHNIKRKDMEEHRTQCSLEPVQCPFEEVGCKKRFVRRELEQHKKDTQQHLLMVVGAYKEIKKACEEMKTDLEVMKERNAEMIRTYKEMLQANEEMKKAKLENTPSMNLERVHKETMKELHQIKEELKLMQSNNDVDHRMQNGEPRTS